MKDWINKNPMITLLGIISIIVVLVGGICVIRGTYDDDFAQWVNDLIVLSGAIGLFGAGRAVKNGMLGRTDSEPVIGSETDASGEEDELPAVAPSEEDLRTTFVADPPTQFPAPEGAVGGKPKVSGE